MIKILLIAAVSYLLVACSKDEACDMTGKKYAKMRTEGIPMSEKDAACFQAVVMKGFEDLGKKSKIESEKAKK